MSATMKKPVKAQTGTGEQISPNKRKAPILSPLLMLGSQLLSGSLLNQGLPGFIIQGLDSEQIWQQLELRNEQKSTFTSCTRNAARIQAQATKKHKKKKKKKETEYKIVDKLFGSENCKTDMHSDVSSNSEDENVKMLDSIKKRLGSDSEDNDGDFSDLKLGDSEDDNSVDFDFKLENEMTNNNATEDDDDEDEEKIAKKENNSSKRRNSKRVTEVDDTFFKLADMEEFLDIEDKKEEKRNQSTKSNDHDSDSDNDSSDDEYDQEIDMFKEIDSDQEDAKNLKYSDFFDPPYNEKKKKSKKENLLNEDDKDGEIMKNDKIIDNEEVEDEEVSEDSDEDMEGEKAESEDEIMEFDNEAIENGGKVNISHTQDLLQSDEGEEDGTDLKDNNAKSTFELRQIELQKKAREMEELSLKETSWELKGEATAGKRPENSLLETVLDFQHTAKQTPVITDETTKTLEDYIKQRIKDKVFDSVERKFKPTEDAFEFKKRIQLDQEKSKLSLGQLYEQEFLKQQQQDEDQVKDDPECEKIEVQLNKLFRQLDALSNFRYTPIKPGTEVKIVVNTPAIAMEEVAPVAAADADLLAPEEIYDKKKGDLKGSDERTSTDKKRELRQKKKDKRERKKAREAHHKAVERMNPGLGNKHSKEKARKQLEEMSKGRQGVTLIKGEGSKVKSSTAFFNQLQDEVQTQSRAKKVSKAAKKQKLDPSLVML